MQSATLRGFLAPAWAALLGAAIGSGSARGDEPPARPAKLEQVIVVFKTHFDVGYTDLARNVVERYRTSMIDKALLVCDHTKTLPEEHRFVWTLPGWPMQQVLWPDQTPERRRHLNEAIAAGRLVWHALPCSLHTESLDLEDLVRGLGFSSELSRQFGMPLARDAKMTDVPSHTWILPTLLVHAGIDFLHLGCNSASASPEVPPLFWWEGPDGSRVLTMYEASGYGNRLEPPPDWPHKTHLALIHTGDNHGPPTPGEVEKLLAEAQKKLPGVKVRMGRLSDFGDAIRAENPELPVVRADMPDTWIHGLMSMPAETKIARNLRPRIAALEALDTLLGSWGVAQEASPTAADPPLAATVAAAYEGSLMYGEHTWGASVPLNERLYGEAWRRARVQGRYQKMEASWREHGAYIRGALAAVEPALADRLDSLARSVAVAGRRVVVFNPLPWVRDDVVTLPVLPEPVTALEDVAGSHMLPVETDGDRLRFLARELPPQGYRTYVPVASKAGGGELSADAARGVIESSRWRVRLNAARGVIASLVDKHSGRELVDATSPYGFGQYLYERFDAEINQRYYETYCKYIPSWVGHFARFDMPPADEVPYKAASPGLFVLAVRLGAVSVSATMTAAPGEAVPHQVALEVTLYEDQPFVDLRWQITDKEPDTWPESGWLCLPLAVERPRFRLGRLGSIVDPAGDLVPGSNHEVFCLNSGMTVTDRRGLGAGLCPADAPLVSLGRLGVYRYSKTFTEREPVVFLNLFNNVWGTNFQQWIGGSWSSRVRLWAVEGRGDEADLVTPAWATRNPALAVAGDAPAGPLPPVGRGVELSCPGVLLTALGNNPDGNGLLLRVWEQAGEDRTCRVHLPPGLDAPRAQPCDLRGRPQGEPLAVENGRFDVPLTRFAPASFLLEPAADR